MKARGESRPAHPTRQRAGVAEIGTEQTGQDLEGRRLAGTVGPDDPQRLARRDLEGDILERPELFWLEWIYIASARQRRNHRRDESRRLSKRWPRLNFFQTPSKEMTGWLELGILCKAIFGAVKHQPANDE